MSDMQNVIVTCIHKVIQRQSDSEGPMYSCGLQWVAATPSCFSFSSARSYLRYGAAGAGDRELGCIKCLPCSSSSHSSFGALAPLLLFSAFVLSHFLANSYTFDIYFCISLKYFLLLLNNACLLRLPSRISFFCALFLRTIRLRT